MVATCGLRISEPLGLKWRNILWDRGLVAIKQTFVHFNVQEGATTKLSRSRVEAPKLLLDCLAAWRKETMYAGDENFVFPSVKLGATQPRSGSMLVEDYIRQAAIKAGAIKSRDLDHLRSRRRGCEASRFHNLGRHSLATFLMDEQENPAVVQAIMRHAKMDMTLYHSHSSRKRSVRRRKKCSSISSPKKCEYRCRYRRRFSENRVVQELVYNDELTALQWALNSAVECHLHTVEVIGSNPIAPTI